MSENGLMSINEASRVLGVNRVTISDLVRNIGIQTKPMSNGKAKGLDATDLRTLRKALGMTRREPVPAVS
jgi:hypothetical protein